MSIVTPAYNAALHIAGCIDSVLAQSYESWDWTIVDNCSTDGTAEIVRELSRGDVRIRLVQNDRFLSVTENHNEACRHISESAKYCKVVAADDRLFPDCIRSMVAVAEAHPRVTIVGAYALEHDRVRFDGVPFPLDHIDGRQACRDHMLGGPYIFGVPTSVMYRADIVRSRSAFFNEENRHSDTEVCVEFLENAEFGFVHQILCCLGTREGSETAYSDRIDTYRYGMMQAVLTHGRRYFSESEWKDLVDLKMAEYRRFLGEQALKGREPEFWHFHLGKLEELGFSVTRLQILGAALGFLRSRLVSGVRWFFRGLLMALRRQPRGQASQDASMRSDTGRSRP